MLSLDSLDDFRSLVRRFVVGEIDPFVDTWEAAGIFPAHSLLKKMGALGLLGIGYDPTYGGQGLDIRHDLVFLEELGRAKSAGVTLGITVQTHMATPALHRHGSAALKEEYLRPAIAGELVGAIGVTEPGAGSDVYALRTRAIRDGDFYRISGAKMFITNGTQADFMTTLVQTSDGPSHDRYSLLIVPTRLPGVTISAPLRKLGMRASDTAEIVFDRVAVPISNRIGEEGAGFRYQMEQFQIERFAGSVTCLTACDEMLRDTIGYVRQRIVFGKPLINKQVIRHRLVDLLTEIECCRQLLYSCAERIMQRCDALREVSMAKLKIGQLARQVGDECLQMHGGYGYMEEYRVSRFFRDMRLTSIGGGADEVMREIIAKISGLAGATRDND